MPQITMCLLGCSGCLLTQVKSLWKSHPLNMPCIPLIFFYDINSNIMKYYQFIIQCMKLADPGWTGLWRQYWISNKIMLILCFSSSVLESELWKKKKSVRNINIPKYFFCLFFSFFLSQFIGKYLSTFILFFWVMHMILWSMIDCNISSIQQTVFITSILLLHLVYNIPFIKSESH